MWPLGSDQRIRFPVASLMSRRPIKRPNFPVVSTTNPPALTSSTRFAYGGLLFALFGAAFFGSPGVVD